MIRAGAHFDGLYQRADGHGVVALDKVVHLGQNQHHVAQFFGLHAAGQHIGELEGLVFGNFDLIHDFVYPYLIVLQFLRAGQRNVIGNSRQRNGRSRPAGHCRFFLCDHLLRVRVMGVFCKIKCARRQTPPGT